jgi:hypothetical protein
VEKSDQAEEQAPLIPEVIDAEPVAEARPSEREQSTTVGTGSYIAVSCSAVALLVTVAILAILFLIRWLS